MKYAVVIEEDRLDGGYIASVPSLKGCFTQADSLDELKIRIKEAIEVSLEEQEPKTSLLGILEMEVPDAAIADN